MGQNLPHLVLYQQEDYWRGNKAISGYDDYNNCRSILKRWAGMVHAVAGSTSVLDVGAAYGFVVEYFHQKGIPAAGVDPSQFCLNQAAGVIQDRMHWGALPDQGFFAAPAERWHTVTCTEVMEHVPPELVPASLQALADRTEKYLICLIMLDCPEAHNDEGHLCLEDREWWEAQFDATGLARATVQQDFLNNYSFSRLMDWSGRFFVRERL